MSDEATCFREAQERWREEKRDQLLTLARTNDPLAHLLGVLDGAAKMLREIGSGADALVHESHRAQLVAGREWPGSPVRSPFPPDLSAVDQGDGDPR